MPTRCSFSLRQQQQQQLPPPHPRTPSKSLPLSTNLFALHWQSLKHSPSSLTSTLSSPLALPYTIQTSAVCLNDVSAGVFPLSHLEPNSHVPTRTVTLMALLTCLSEVIVNFAKLLVPGSIE